MAIYSRAQEKRKLRKELTADARARDKAKLAGLRNLVGKAKKHKKSRMANVVKECRKARARNKVGAKKIRVQKRGEANIEIELRMLRARRTCGLDKHQAKTRGDDSITRAKGSLDEERRAQRIMRIYGKPAKALGSVRQVRAPVAKETKAQISEAEVLANIPEELLPVWHKVKGRMRGDDWKSRTEAFLEWVQENQGEVYTILEADTETYIRRMEAEERALQKEMMASAYAKLTEPQLRRRSRRRVEEYAEVPF